MSDDQTARTLLGQSINVDLDEGVMINDAMVSVTDIRTFNGVVHVIDAVMLPPASNVVDVVVNSDVHNTLETAVVEAQLAGALSGEGPFTVFAPTDAAFEMIPEEDLNALLADPTGNLQKILRYHVLGTEVVSAALSDGQSARTLLGQSVNVDLDSEVMINNAMVTVADIEPSME